jgi:hypothetical protein
MDDKVNRLFIADRPNKLWVSDFTYVQTWSGTVYVAFVIDVFARRIVGWRASTSMKTQFVLPSRQICFANRLPTARQCIENAREGGNGRTGASNLAKKNAKQQELDPPFGPRLPILVHQVYRAPGRGRDRTLGRHSR